MITKQIYEPQTCANPSDRYLGEVRWNGWLIDYNRMESREDVQEWLDKHDSTVIAPHVTVEYGRMFRRWSNESKATIWDDKNELYNLKQ